MNSNSTLLKRSRDLAIDCIAFKNAYLKTRSVKKRITQQQRVYIESLEPSQQILLKKREQYFALQLTTA